MRYRPSRRLCAALGTLALIGLLPVAGPAAANPPEDGTLPDDVVDGEAGEPATVGLPWLSRTAESLALSLRAQAGLPTAEPIPTSASGELETFTAEPVEGDEAPDGARVVAFEVEVERGLPADGDAFASFVTGILADERSWQQDAYGNPVHLVPAGSEDAEGADLQVRIILASPDLVDELCAPLQTGGQYSCGTEGRAVLNAVRWSEGAEAFRDGGGTITEYRRYLVNHEVGHLLGYGHAPCPADGEPAPVMLQQTMRLEGCEPNGWPAESDEA